MHLVTPKTFIIGYTQADIDGLYRYLDETEQSAFKEDIEQALREGLSPGEVLCSFYAKLCYASLVPGRNKNISATRAIRPNIRATLEHGHGSVFEHFTINFVTTNCSRVFTHELVRHRVGTAFSQTSGRYVRTEELGLVFDPILELAKTEVEAALLLIEAAYREIEAKVMPVNANMTTKKKVTSALRRILPEGRPNEIGWSINIRAVRHLIMLRTSRHAEWEIRKVFGDVYQLLDERYPLLFNDAQSRIVDGLPEVYGMRLQPYDLVIKEE